MTIDEPQHVPLAATDDGTIRVRGTRVSLDSVVHHFKLGATPEQIAHKFPALSLADIYHCAAYYLDRRLEVDEYLQRQERGADELQRRLESDPQFQRQSAEMRERLLTRRAAHDRAA